MARTTNLVVSNLQGTLGKQVVMRVRNGKTFLSKYPDMSGVKPSSKQLKLNTRFAKAVAFAQSVLRNPAKRAAVKAKKGQTVYHAAIQEYLKKN